MDLSELEAELAQLSKQKLRDDETVTRVNNAVNKCLEKVVVACVDGKGNPLKMFDHLTSKAQSWKREATSSAKPTSDQIARRAGDLAASLNVLRGMQSGEPALMPKLSGKQTIAVMKALEPMAAYCGDESISTKLDTDKFDKLYFDAALALCHAGVEFKAIPEVLSSYNSMALRNARVRMEELVGCMKYLDRGNDAAESKIHAAQTFSSIFKSIENSVGDKTNYEQLDQAIADGIVACAESGMGLSESVEFLKSGLSGDSLEATIRLQEYFDVATALATSVGAELGLEPAALCQVVQSLDGVKAVKNLSEESIQKFDRAYSQAFHSIRVAGLTPEQTARLIQGQVAVVVDQDLGSLLEQMANVQQFVPVPHPITVEYVEVARRCCAPLKSLKEAGADIKQLDEARQALRGFAVVVMQHPGCVNFTSAMESLQGWVEQEAASGTLFKPDNAGFSGRLFGNARYYDKELKTTTVELCTQCEEFDSKIEESAKPDSVSKFKAKTWTALKGMSAELESAYMKRALQSPHITAVDMPDEYKAVAPVPVVENSGGNSD